MNKEFEKLIDSRQVFTIVNTVELDRACEKIKSLVEYYNSECLPNREVTDDSLKRLGFSVEEWAYGRGWGINGSQEKEFFAMLRSIKARRNAILIIRNFGYVYDTNTNIPQLIEMMIDTYKYCENSLVYLFFVGRTGRIPAEIMPLFTTLEFDLPTEDELKELVLQIFENEGVKDKSLAEPCALAVKGLTFVEAERAVNIAILHGNKKNPVNFEKLYAQKADLVKKSEILEYVTNTETVNDLGGMVNLKEHYGIVKAFYENREGAKKYGLKPPRGCLLVGVQGCGKSLSAKVVANMFKLPLYRWDIGKVYGSLVGETEEKTRLTLKLIKAISPAVVLIDEAEKMFAGYQSSAETSSGVVNRVLGEVLYFMEEENKEGAFFFFTSNSIDDLPPELIRSGRLDDIWFVDLPKSLDRQQIFEIHIRKTGRDPSKYDLVELATVTEGYTGADIANAVQKAMFYGFVEKRDYTNKDILKALTEVTPFYTTHKNTVEKLREWAKIKAKDVGSLKEMPATNKQQILRRKIK